MITEDIQHKMWKVTLEDKLHLASINPSKDQALDIRTGNGNWAIDFGNLTTSFVLKSRIRTPGLLKPSNILLPA